MEGTFIKKGTNSIYYLKNGRLYDTSYSRIYATPRSLDSLSMGEKYSLLVDDSHFFYVHIGKIGTSKKKLRPMIQNYLQSIFPMDLFAGFAIVETKGSYTALLYKNEFQTLLKSNEELFAKASSITTVFCELSARYMDFVFTDGTIIYAKKEFEITALQSLPEGAISADDVLGDLNPLKSDIQIPDLSRSKGGISGMKWLLIAVFICYACFLAAGVLGVVSAKRSLSFHELQLQERYNQAGVADSPDPYGLLLSKADRKVSAPFKVMSVLNAIGGVSSTGVKVEGLTISEKLIRVEGLATSFSDMDSFKAELEKITKKSLSVDDSRQVGESVKFVIRFEP